MHDSVFASSWPSIKNWYIHSLFFVFCVQVDAMLIHRTCVQYTPTIIITVLRADLGPKPCDCLWPRLFPLPRPGLMFVTSANCSKRLRCCRNSGSSLRFILAGASGILLFQHPAISTKKIPIIFHSKKSDAWKCILLTIYSIEFSHIVNSLNQFRN